MGRKKNYSNITGWWVYIIKLPNNTYYTGCSQQYPTTRFQPSKYERTTLHQSIEKFGWENLEKIVLVDNLTKQEALEWEDCLICMYTKLGCCINKQRSGLISHNKKQYQKQYYEDRKEKISEYQKQYYEDHKEERMAYNKQYREDHKEERRKHRKQYYKDHKEEIKQYYLLKKKKIF